MKIPQFHCSCAAIAVAVLCLTPFTRTNAQDNAFVFKANVPIPMRDGTELTANIFQPEGSNFPRFDRNPNSGLPFGSDTELFSATQTVFHGGEHASHILLPVIPR